MRPDVDRGQPRSTTGVGEAPGRRLRPVPFLLGFAALYGLLAVPARVEASAGRGVAILAVTTAGAVLVLVLMEGSSPRRALADLGLSRPAPRAVWVALGLAGLVQVAYPIAGALTGTRFGLRDGWPLLLVGVAAMHGVAEELVWRGYAFGRLRRGRSFRAAALLSMPLIAATHLPVLLSSGVAVGLAAMLVAATTSLPLAHLYEMGGRTLWAPAVLHAGIDGFKLVEVPDRAAVTFSLVLATVSVVVPLMALLVPRNGALARHPRGSS